jgi:Ser/Thr protein kinase RdoA (MazF antagonist)
MIHNGCIVTEESSAPSATALPDLLRAHGLDVAALRPVGSGESASAFWVTDYAGTVSVLKVESATSAHAAAGFLPAVSEVVRRLRARGYPAPRFLAIGRTPDLVFWVQERMPGAELNQDSVPRFLPELFGLNDAQAGLGAGSGTDRSQWRSLITETLVKGGAGYCVHATLESRPDTRAMLDVIRRVGERCCASIPDGDDFVHYDFTPANLLTDGESITGVIDVNPPVLAGDRAFDLATLLFYLYDDEEMRFRLRHRLLELTDPRAADAYLAHMVLRQVDWSVRHYPSAPETQRHLRLGEMVTADLARTLLAG